MAQQHNSLKWFTSYQAHLSSLVHLCSWYSTNILHLNVCKVTVMCIELCCSVTTIKHVVINESLKGLFKKSIKHKAFKVYCNIPRDE